MARRAKPEGETAPPAEVLAYYAESRIESERLSRGGGLIERLRTEDILARALPPAPATVIDVGGATGAYALPLAARGYTVHLVDPVPWHVEQALAASAKAERPLASATVGDARRLAQGNASADAVLMLGPLYHLTARADRVRALTEARRVLKPGGILVAAAVSRFASAVDGLDKGYIADERFVGMVEEALESGIHRNRTGDPRHFTTAYFHRPDELRDEAIDAGFRGARVVGVDPMWVHGPSLPAEGPARVAFLALLRRLEAEPSLLGASAHLVVLATR